MLFTRNANDLDLSLIPFFLCDLIAPMLISLSSEGVKGRGIRKERKNVLCNVDDEDEIIIFC
jgi:hypothetical protein